MKKIILLLMNFILIAFVSAETVYKTRDAEGNIIFSDVKTEGAETIEIQEAQTLNIPKPKYENRPTTKLTPKETNYKLLEIVSPENDATIRSNEGNVDISIQVEPAIDEKHQLVVSLDGTEVASGKSLQVSLSGLDRGSHSVTAVIKNDKEKVIMQSKKLVFYLHKQSKLFKNRADQNATNPNNSGTIVAPSTESEASPVTPEIPSL